MRFARFMLAIALVLPPLAVGAADLQLAQGYGGSPRGSSPPPAGYDAPPPAGSRFDTFQIYNASNQVLNFETFDPSRGHWRPRTLGPGQVDHIAFRGGYSEGRIRVATQGRGYVEYTVQEGRRYELIWDQYKRAWDVRRIRRGG
jgi:hypothetical protein